MVKPTELLVPLGLVTETSHGAKASQGEEGILNFRVLPSGEVSPVMTLETPARLIALVLEVKPLPVRIISVPTLPYVGEMPPIVGAG